MTDGMGTSWQENPPPLGIGRWAYHPADAHSPAEHVYREPPTQEIDPHELADRILEPPPSPGGTVTFTQDTGQPRSLVQERVPLPPGRSAARTVADWLVVMILLAVVVNLSILAVIFAQWAGLTTWPN